MTPQAVVKTTLASETRLPGLPVASGGPIFLGLANAVVGRAVSFDVPNKMRNERGQTKFLVSTRG
jgi:hypothetical protein